MKTPISCLSLALFLLPASTFAQGSLTPPGPPAPTMHTLDQLGTKTDQANATLNQIDTKTDQASAKLDQIDTKTDQASAKLDQIDARSERRTPISSLPFTISSAGSYYLTNNLTATADGAGITVSANNVTIDLNGFALTGGGGGKVAGIAVATVTNLTVRNGIVSGWTQNGIDATNAVNSSFEDLRISGNSSSGPVARAGLSTGRGCHIQRCVSEKQISIPGIATGFGCSVTDCTSSHDGADGFVLGPGNAITNCSAFQAGISGIDAGGGALVVHCSASFNNAAGISTAFGSTVADCAASANGTGIMVNEYCVVRNSAASENENNGIVCTHDSNLTGNNCSGNNSAAVSTNGGIFSTGAGNRIEGNMCNANGSGGNGIYTTGNANHIEGNSCDANLVNTGMGGVGIVAKGSNNFIIKNSASGNTGFNYDIAGAGGTNTIGPVIDSHTGSTISTTNPWANWIH